MTLSQSSWTPTVQLRGSHTELLPRASAPKPYANGTCYTYLVKGADTCFALAASYSLTVNDINNFNNNTWGWTGCGNLLADINICLSTGYPPMPPPVAGTECGPQVPGTNPPEPGESLANLNLCPLNACCDIWGHCGVTSDYCTVSTSSTGAPGTAAPGENGCVSMCGNDIISSAAPAEFRRIAYFEGFNWDRPCLNMEATDIPEVYTHVHFAFANLTEGYQIDLGHQTIQFELFLGMTRFKKIISIGGWAFSTDPSTYHIFRDAVSNEANRATLVQNIVDFVELFGLDGVDIDWEYPGAPDIPGIPPGNINEGAHYAVFLSELRAALPSTASLSIAAPASYYYLKQFLIEATAMFVDYIVFMTYDLHGQWDYDKAWANPGCPTGNCLRSHVNISETLTALSMITKAGVPSNQVAVGVSSYARAFKMVDPSCTGPQCLFTGPLSGAEPGPCTGTPGYIANAELEGIISNVNINSTQYVDSLSDSNILIWDGNWAAYMDDGNKFTRTRVYQALHFAGTSDWGADLQTIS
ncbi:glycoside hydrolase, partial [Thozetella sp. PMI_491]